MSNLQQLQQRFQSYILTQAEAIKQDIVSTENALAEHRLGTYYNAYRLRLIECLETEYPIVKKTLGEEAFITLALSYFDQHPSDHPSARWVGRRLPQFIQNTDTFLGELAQFEWQKGLTFDAATPKSIASITHMAAIAPKAWPSLTFSFQASVRLLDFHWNAITYWQALNTDQPLPEKQKQAIANVWLLWRKGHDPHWRSLEVSEAWALHTCLQGADFATLCTGLVEWVDETQVSMVAASYLKQWVQDELITEIHS